MITNFFQEWWSKIVKTWNEGTEAKLEAKRLKEELRRRKA